MEIQTELEINGRICIHYKKITVEKTMHPDAFRFLRCEIILYQFEFVCLNNPKFSISNTINNIYDFSEHKLIQVL